MAEEVPAEIKAEVAIAQTDPFQWLYGDRVLTQDEIIRTRGAGKGLALYDELLRDPQVATCLDKRVSALAGREWKVEAGVEGNALAQQAADLAAAAFNGMRFTQGTRKMLRALLSGVSVGEVMWVIRGNTLMPRVLLSRNPRRFTFTVVKTPDEQGQEESGGTSLDLRMLTRTSPIDGIPIPDRKFVVHRFGDSYENPWGLGLGHRLFWPVFFKRQGIGFWMSGLDKFSQPTALGHYPVGTTEDQQRLLVEALTAISREAGVAIPEGMAIELLEAKRSGTFDAYESLAMYMDGEITKAILGETLTTQGGSSGGNRALGQVHNEVRLELTKADADDLSDTLNSSLVRWIVDLNLPGYEASGLPYPAIMWDVAVPDDLLTRAQRDVQIVALGYKPTPEYIAATYGEGWVPATPAPAAPPSQDALEALFAEAGKAARKAPAVPASPNDAADDLTAQAGPLSAHPVGAWIDQLGALVEHAESMQDIANGLLALYPKLTTQDLAGLIGQALAVGDLTGRLDLQNRIVPPGGDV
jgi:phage gp29-like protein